MSSRCSAALAFWVITFGLPALSQVQNGEFTGRLLILLAPSSIRRGF